MFLTRVDLLYFKVFVIVVLCFLLFIYERVCIMHKLSIKFANQFMIQFDIIETSQFVYFNSFYYTANGFIGVRILFSKINNAY